MTEQQCQILELVAKTGSVPANTFSGKGKGTGNGIAFVVAMLVRRGYLTWERGRLPNSSNATALLITDLGRQAVLDAVGGSGK